MRFRQNTFLLLIAAALVAVGIGIFRTNQKTVVQARATRRSLNVDQSSLVTAEQLVRQPTTPEERSFASDALRLADQEMDLAFAQAVRRASTQAPTKSPEVSQLTQQLDQALRAAAADQAQVTELTAAVAKAGPSTVQALTDRLELAKAQLALDQDEVDDARQDLQRAGGDPQGRIQSIVAEHEAASRASDSTRIVITRAAPPRGMLGAADAVFTLRDKVRQLDVAKGSADSLATIFQQRHDSIEARVARMVDSANAHLTHDSSAALLELTRNRAASEKRRATLDQRVDNQHRLSETYSGWSAVVASQARAMLNQVLRGAATILSIVLVGMLLARWFERLVRGRTADHRRAQTIYMIARATLQVLGVLLILLVVFGPPNDVGTVLGLAAAGLSVALKDFIVGFLGWFVLMGKNGIRVGDQVEINGVTGEVVEIGMFYTVLLETGAWSESHPTGRRVTFTNSFAIEGHYFNFSTSGRWMWDEVRIQVPSARDPHAIAAALEAQIEAATTESAQRAQEEWREARRSPHAATIEAAPSISIRPASSGFEIVARYITQASERDTLRARLYQTAIELLAAKDGPRYSAGVAQAAPTR
ncbi:MAG TPA: mechanosensitive ion channel domain-containing protein [Gemmatimonadaceae bacterium]|jgi:small-conductance mechanosensitive channel|nr:mechanosensitive ion channel domain-containing protein [Gemmatimonadaceae bacterium]